MIKKRVEGLDIVRVLCALAICAFHTSVHLNCSYGLLDGFIKHGAVLMSTFFMLSGFVLSVSYCDFSGKKLMLSFFKKRIISILPLYYICAFGSDIINTYIRVVSGGGTRIRSTGFAISTY